MNLLFILSLLFTIGSAVDRNVLKGLRPCFERYPNHKLTGVKSFHSEYRMASEEECLHLCALTATRCRSIVYDYSRHLCHFFLDDGAQQAEFMPKMIYFRVTNKDCLQSALSTLPEDVKSLPSTTSTTSQPSESDYASPVVAKKRIKALRRKTTLDGTSGTTTTSTTTTTTTSEGLTMEEMGIKKEAMEELIKDIEHNTEMFEEEQRREEEAMNEQEKKTLRKIKEKIRKKLRSKIQQLRETFPDMYEELLGGEKNEQAVEEEEEVPEKKLKKESPVVALSSKTVKSTKRKLNDASIERTKVARAPEKKKIEDKGGEEEYKDEDTLPTGTVGEDGQKKFLAIPDPVSEEVESMEEPGMDNHIEETDHQISRGNSIISSDSKPKSEIRMSPRILSKNHKKSEVEKNTMEKLQMFAQQIMDDGIPKKTVWRDVEPSNGMRIPSLAKKYVQLPPLTTTSPVEQEIKFIMNNRPIVNDHTMEMNNEPTGCMGEEVPLWIRFENAEPDTKNGGDFSNVENRGACEKMCNGMEGVRSLTFSDKDSMCQCNVDFDGISMKRSVKDDFSISTSSRFCFSKSLSVFQHCGFFMGFRDFTLNVSPREQFDGLPPSYEGLQLCIELCTLSTEYECKSASFDLRAGRCSLNDADSTTHPTEFMPIMVDNLLYFENSCERSDAFKQKESLPSSVNVNRVSTSEVAADTRLSSSVFTSTQRPDGIGGLKVRPIRRDSYTLKTVSFS